MGLWEVVGCRETAVETGDRGRTSLRWTDGAWPGMALGEQLPARWYEETLEPLSSDARVVARFAGDAPAAIASSFGRGKTLMLGSYVSAAYETAASRETERFYAGLLKWAGVSLPVSGGKVEVRTLESGLDRVVSVFNHQKAAADASVSLPMAAADYAAADLVEERTVPTVRNGEFLEVKKRIDAGGVWVVSVRRR